MQIESSFETIEKTENLSDMVVKDARGRELTLQEPELMETLDIIELLGAERAANSTYTQMVETILWVKKIDGITVSIPQTYLQLKHLINKIGNAGYRAVLTYFSIANQKIVDKYESEVAAAKKSAETPILPTE